HQFGTVDAGFPVDAQADFDLVLPQLKTGGSRRRHDAGSEGHSHASDLPDHLVGDRLHLFQGGAAGCQGAGDLVDEDGAGNSPAARRVGAVFDGHVVVDDHLRHADALRFGHFRGHFEIHHVARVVFDDEENPVAAVHRLERFQHLVGSGGGEHLTRDRRIQHALSHIPRMGGFMAASAAADQPHLSGYGGVGPDDDLRAGKFFEMGMGGHHAVQHVPHHLFRRIDQLFHIDSPSSKDENDYIRRQIRAKKPYGLKTPGSSTAAGIEKYLQRKPFYIFRSLKVERNPSEHFLILL